MSIAKLITPPTVEPLSVDEAIAHLRADGTEESAQIALWISAAREDAENVCRRAFITQEWDLFLDTFPLPSFIGILPGYVPMDQTQSAWDQIRNYSVRIRDGKIWIPFPVLQSVEFVKYRDETGAWVTLDPSQYIVDAAGEPGAITPAPGVFWPASTYNAANSVQIRFKAGYGDTAASVPASIKAWMLMRVGALYENREEISVAARVTVQELPFVDRLLDRYIIRSYT
jgi:uncharacterized phiE125 gp8 family phage protein